MKIGIDIGGVIIDRVKDGVYDTSFKQSDSADTPPVKDALVSVRELTSLFGPQNVYLVSVCDSKTEQKTNEWLEANNFFEVTGMLKDNVYNCLERSQKTGIAKNLGLTHFVDDRPDVLEHMIGTVSHLYLFSTTNNRQRISSTDFNLADGWQETLTQVKQTIA